MISLKGNSWEEGESAEHPKGKFMFIPHFLRLILLAPPSDVQKLEAAPDLPIWKADYVSLTSTCPSRD